jgi:hypothetical protein
MHTPFSRLLLFTGTAALLAACSKKDDAAIVPVTPASGGSKLTLNGGPGGTAAPNSVFVQLSTNTQDSAKRVSWDLGFYNGDDFRVIINHSTGATAIALDKTDLNQVTAQDTVPLVTNKTLLLGQGDGSFSVIDPVDAGKTSYLNGTVIKQVSAADANNKVYIVNTGSAGVLNSNGTTYPPAARKWQKIRVLRNGNGYKLQYADITATGFKEASISKDAAYNFSYFSFSSGAVKVEPPKNAWDIEWTLTTYKATATIPYTFSDFVLINFLNGVQAAEVETSAVSYDNFNESHIGALQFSSNRDAIGDKWRVTSGNPSDPGAEPVGVRTSRFFVIKDVAGNVYKLKFVSFIANDGGVRGFPVIEYKLVKKA